MGFVNVAMWFFLFVKIAIELPDVASKIPQAELDARVLQNQTYLTYDIMAEIIDPGELNQRINDVFIVAREIYDFHMLIRAFFFGYFLLMILKFFKSFQADVERLSRYFPDI